MKRSINYLLLWLLLVRTSLSIDIRSPMMELGPLLLCKECEQRKLNSSLAATMFQPDINQDAAQPQICLLPNVRLEDRVIVCSGGWCEKKTFCWSVAEQKAHGAMIELAPPLLCNGCQRKLDSSPAATMHHCKDCEKPYWWIYKKGERRFFEKKGFRCAACRSPSQQREEKRHCERPARH